MTIQLQNRDTRMVALDGLRGCAVLAVVAYHTLRITGSVNVFGALWRALQESAWIGVDLFFALSGFLITGILIDSRSKNGYFRNFYARRTLRIFPLYYAVLFMACVLIPICIGLRHLPARYEDLISNQIWLWTYTQNYLQATARHTLPGFGHFWTLAIEEQFYWFWPLIVYRLSNRALLRISLIICFSEPLLRAVLLSAGVSTWALRQYTFTRLDTLVFGAIAAIVLRDSALLIYPRLVPVTVGASAALLATILFRTGYLPFEGAATVVVGYSAVALLSCILIYIVAVTNNAFTQLLSSPTLRWFGKYSYAIYVFHWPVAQVCEVASLRIQNTLPWVAEYRFLLAACSFLSTLAASSGMALLSWRLLEGPILNLKHRFEYSDKSLMSGQKLMIENKELSGT